jgi:hypothetical protein
MTYSPKKNKKRRLRHKGRATTGRFLMLPHRVLKSSEFASLSPRAVKLLIETASRFNGQNNGDLSATFSELSKRGWRSAATLDKAKKELVKKKWLILTRQGGRNKCSLFAVSWLPVDECNGKIEYPSESIASDLWKTESVVHQEAN